MNPRITLLCGGVGGARAALALSENLPAQDLRFIVNTGDDFTHLGLEIWPDWDTVLYTLSGLGDPIRGWGRRDEGTRAMEEWDRLGGPTWFHLGDRDLALHVYRQWAIGIGHSRTKIAADIALKVGLAIPTLRVTHQSLATSFLLQNGSPMDFQSWFVRHQGRPLVKQVCVARAQDAWLTEGVIEAIDTSDLLLIAPSNPYLSIEPMLKIPALNQAISRHKGRTWVVSPLIDGKAVKGPLDALIETLSPTRGQQAIAHFYEPWAQALLLPSNEIPGLTTLLQLQPCHTRLTTPEDRTHFCADLLRHWHSR